ncbi:twin-arginine translocase TatA/TatE family subunit [Brucellaceae bacterium D45D]
MGSLSVWHWLIVLAVVLLLFGRGKIPELMGDVAKGIKNFKQGMNDDDAKDDVNDDGRTIDAKANETVKPVKKTAKS